MAGMAEMAGEASLPPLKRTAPLPDEQQQKRVKLHSTPPAPSNPAFSSNDDDPSTETNSALGEWHKSTFIGRWYSRKPVNKKTKMGFQRQLGSWAWLGSDSTQDDEGAAFIDRAQPGIAVKGRRPLITKSSSVKSLNMNKLTREPTGEEFAEGMIRYYIEAGKKNIFLSGGNITHLSNAVIKPLSTILAMVRTAYGTPMPGLRLSLSYNRLRRVPGEIFNLEDLVSLALGDNLVVDLPSAIGRLHRLISLDVSDNNLHFLPYEILDLCSHPSNLHSLQIHPNPFYEPELANVRRKRSPRPHQLRDYVRSTNDTPYAFAPLLIPEHANWSTKYQIRSRVRFLDNEGRLLKGPFFPRDQSLFTSPHPQRNAQDCSHPSGGNNSIPVAPADDIPEPPHSFSNAPSLLEVAIRAWSRDPEMPDMASWLGYDPPERLARIMEDTKLLQEMEAESRQRTICKRRFVIPRTEWIEWWQMTKTEPAQLVNWKSLARDESENTVPLVRRGCSWACIPRRAEPEEAQRES